MTTDLIKAIELLNEKQYTCVMCKDKIVYTSTERGVKPLLDWIIEGINLQGFYAADKVVGKAAAFLYTALDVKAVYAGVMSESAIHTLVKNGIQPHYSISVMAIQNRSNTGFCPMEEAVKDIDNQQDAIIAIKNRLVELNQTKV